MQFLGPTTQVHIPNGISISSSIFEGLSVVTNRETDRQTDRQMHRETDKQRGKQAGRETDRQR